MKKDVEPEAASPLPTRRVVLLGASNLARGLSTVVEAACCAWGRPVDIVAALGHGRSYGAESRVLGRTLPGILQCGLWDALDQRPAGPTAALVTDIGNDLVFGVGVPQVAAWVDDVLHRLRPRCERLVVTELPLASLERLGPKRFLLLRTLLFPRSRQTLEELLAKARSLNARVVQLARKHDAALLAPRDGWYGFDPIHVRRRERAGAWSEIFGAWCERPFDPAHPARGSAWRLRRQRPLYRRWFGIEQRRRQPTCILPDGSPLSLY